MKKRPSELFAGLLLLRTRNLMKLWLQMFRRRLTQRLFHEPAGITTLGTGEPVSFHLRLTVFGHSNLDSFQETPPTLTVNLIDPSSSDCSVTEWPFLRASSVAFSTA